MSDFKAAPVQYWLRMYPDLTGGACRFGHQQNLGGPTS